MNACEHITDLGPYLDGELDAGRRIALEGHLPGCAACREEVAQLRGMAGLFAGAGQPVLPKAAVWRLHGRVNAWVQEAARAEREAERAACGVLRITRVLIGIAACVLVAGSLWLAQTRQTASPRNEAVATTNGTTVEPWERFSLTGAIPGDTENVSATSSTPSTSGTSSVSAGDFSADLMVGGLLNPSAGSAGSSGSANEGAE